MDKIHSIKIRDKTGRILMFCRPSEEVINNLTNVQTIAINFFRKREFPIPKCVSLEAKTLASFVSIDNLSDVGQFLVNIEIYLLICLRNDAFAFPSGDVVDWKKWIKWMCDQNMCTNLRKLRIITEFDEPEDWDEVGLIAFLRSCCEFDVDVTLKKCKVVFTTPKKYGSVSVKSLRDIFYGWSVFKTCEVDCL